MKKRILGALLVVVSPLSYAVTDTYTEVLFVVSLVKYNYEMTAHGTNDPHTYMTYRHEGKTETNIRTRDPASGTYTVNRGLQTGIWGQPLKTGGTASLWEGCFTYCSEIHPSSFWFDPTGPYQQPPVSEYTFVGSAGKSCRFKTYSTTCWPNACN